MSGTKGKELYAPYQEEGETHRAARPPTYPKPEKGTGRFSIFNSSMQVLLLRHTPFYSIESQCEQGWIVIVPFLEYLVE